MKIQKYLLMAMFALIATTASAEERLAFYLDCLGQNCISLKSSTGEQRVESEPSLVLSTSDLKDVSEHLSQYGLPEIGIILNDQDARKFADLTKANVGKRIHIVIGDEIVMSPTIQGEISNGSLIITNGARPEIHDLLLSKLPQLKEKVEAKKRVAESREKLKAYGIALMVLLAVGASLVFIFRKKKRAI